MDSVMLQVWNSQKLFHVMARCNIKKVFTQSKNVRRDGLKITKKIHQTGGRMEQENTCVPKRRTIEKNKGCQQKEASKPSFSKINAKKEWKQFLSQKEENFEEQKLPEEEEREKHVLEYYKLSFWKIDEKDISMFYFSKEKKKRREICKRVKDNERTIHRKKKKERHDKNKYNFENVKVCNVTVLSRVSVCPVWFCLKLRCVKHTKSLWEVTMKNHMWLHLARQGIIRQWK